jgi:hypothetical protein
MEHAKVSIEFDPETGLPTVAYGLSGYQPAELVKYDGRLYFVMLSYDDTWGPYTPDEAVKIMRDIVATVKRSTTDPMFDPYGLPALDHTVTNEPRFMELDERGSGSVTRRIHDAYFTYLFGAGDATHFEVHHRWTPQNWELLNLNPDTLPPGDFAELHEWDHRASPSHLDHKPHMLRRPDPLFTWLWSFEMPIQYELSKGGD